MGEIDPAGCDGSSEKKVSRILFIHIINLLLPRTSENNNANDYNDNGDQTDPKYRNVLLFIFI